MAGLRGDLLAPRNAAVIKRLASGKVLIGIDYDGTASPAGRDARENTMRPRTRELLRRATELGIPFVAITGRAWAQAVSRFAGTGITPDRVAGNHGFEVAGKVQVSPQEVNRVQRWVELAREALRDIPGVAINNKGPTFAIYDAASANSVTTRARLEKFVRSVPGMGVHRSRYTFDCYSLSGPQYDKATAQAYFMRELGYREGAFLGDAANDHPAFEMLNQSGGFSIGVGTRRPKSARFHLDTQLQLDDFLEKLIAARVEQLGRLG